MMPSLRTMMMMILGGKQQESHPLLLAQDMQCAVDSSSHSSAIGFASWSPCIRSGSPAGALAAAAVHPLAAPVVGPGSSVGDTVQRCCLHTSAWSERSIRPPSASLAHQSPRGETGPETGPRSTGRGFIVGSNFLVTFW